MDNQKNKPIPKSHVISSLLIFIASFVFFIFIWFFVNDYYELAISYVASHLIPVFKGVSLSFIKMRKNLIEIVFVPNAQVWGSNFQINFSIHYYYYTFNVPLTLAIMVSFYRYLKIKKIYLEAVLILIIFHVFFVFFLEWYKVTFELMRHDLEKPNRTMLNIGQYLETFMVIIAVRIVPFLIGVYLFVRMRSSSQGRYADNEV
jgi:hypothetical protein